MKGLDRYITGNWGADQFRDEVPEELWCADCDGYKPDCKTCGGTGYDQAKLAAHRAEMKAQDDAEYKAYLESHGEDADV